MSVLESNTFYTKHFVDSLWFIPYDAQSWWNGTCHAFDDHQQGKGIEIIKCHLSYGNY